MQTSNEVRHLTLHLYVKGVDRVEEYIMAKLDLQIAFVKFVCEIQGTLCVTAAVDIPTHNT